MKRPQGLAAAGGSLTSGAPCPHRSSRLGAAGGLGTATLRVRVRSAWLVDVRTHAPCGGACLRCEDLLG